MSDMSAENMFQSEIKRACAIMKSWRNVKSHGSTPKIPA
jgi:hypothetical protein